MERTVLLLLVLPALAHCTVPQHHAESVDLRNYDWERPVNLTQNGYWDFDPDFSPDGGKIAFHSNRPPSPRNRGQIYVMNSDGSNPVALTQTDATNYMARWSPDGTKIAFASERDGDAEIYLMNSDGSEQVNLTQSPDTYDSGPDWSPDGRFLAFFRGFQRPETDDFQPPGSPYRYWNADLYLLDMESGEETRVTTTDMDDIYPTWSHDGRQLAFTSVRDGNLEIYLIRPDGSDLRRVTNTPFSEHAVSWLPGDRQLSYRANVGDGESPSNNFVLDLESGESIQLTNGKDTVYFSAVLSPDQNTVIYSAFVPDPDGFRGERADIYSIPKMARHPDQER